MDTVNSDELLMEIASLIVDPATHAPIVVLKDVESDTYLPIWIGIAEANSIALALRGLQSQRPLSHDLIRCIVSELGGSVRRVIIYKLEDSTYFANIELSYLNVMRLIDARPSDAIALALRFAAPIIVMRQVVESVQSKVKIGYDYTAGVLGNPVSDDMDDETRKREVGEFTGFQEFEAHNFSAVDRREWAKILSDMNPDDFKYKM